MSAITDCRNVHLTLAASEFDSALNRLKTLIRRGDEASALAEALFTCSWSTRNLVLGGFEWDSKARVSFGGGPHTTFGLMGFTHNFVTYLIEKHGDVAVGHVRIDDETGRYLRCESDHVDAEPFFLASREADWVRSGVDLPAVAPTEALRVIERCEAREASYVTETRAQIEAGDPSCFLNAEELEEHLKDPGREQRRRIIAELKVDSGESRIASEPSPE